MNFNTFVSSQADIDRCRQTNLISEVLLEPQQLARQGRLSVEAVYTLAQAARENGLRPVLVWDILMPETVMQAISIDLATWDFSPFAAVRVCDLGAAWWLRQQHPTMPIQLIVETGSHNQTALLGWCEILAPQLERLILSIELPEEKLIDYSQTLPVACEVMGVGQILLFYSPRSLLATPLANSDSDLAEESPFIQAYVTSEQSSVKHFPTVETQHGTFMFLDKDQFILDRMQPLADAGLHTLRLDLRHLSSQGHAAENIVEVCRAMHHNPQKLRADWPRQTRAPFFKANKTTAQFSRMKSPLHLLRDDSCLAEVVAGKNRKYVVFQTLRAFSVDEVQQLVLPTGDTVDVADTLDFRTINGEPVQQVVEGQLVMCDWIKKACTGALLQGRSVAS